MAPTIEPRVTAPLDGPGAGVAASGASAAMAALTEAATKTMAQATFFISMAILVGVIDKLKEVLKFIRKQILNMLCALSLQPEDNWMIHGAFIGLV